MRIRHWQLEGTGSTPEQMTCIKALNQVTSGIRGACLGPLTVLAAFCPMPSVALSTRSQKQPSLGISRAKAFAGDPCLGRPSLLFPNTVTKLGLFLP